jgi:hypothetical protein
MPVYHRREVWKWAAFGIETLASDDQLCAVNASFLRPVKADAGRLTAADVEAVHDITR